MNLNIYILVGGLEHFLFFHFGNVRIPTDELIFFRGIGIPPTRYEWLILLWLLQVPQTLVVCLCFIFQD